MRRWNRAMPWRHKVGRRFIYTRLALDVIYRMGGLLCFFAFVSNVLYLVLLSFPMRLGLSPHVGGEQHTRTEAQNSGWLQFFPVQVLLFHAKNSRIPS